MNFNTNRKVERHSFGIKEVSPYAKVTEAVAASSFLTKRALIAEENARDARIDQIEKNIEDQKVMENVVRRQIMENQIPLLANKVYQEGKGIVFKELLFEMFSHSLYLDEDFKVAQEQNLRHLVNTYVDNNKGYTLLENAFRTSKSPLLKRLINICESTASSVSKRKLTEAQKKEIDVADIKFELNEDERETFDYEKERIGVDELSELVKTKVLTVVQDEKARQAKEDEIYQDLEQEAQASGESVEEAMSRAVINKSPVEESTLFNSLFRHSYKDVLESVSVMAAHHNDENDPDEEGENYVNTDMDDLRKDDYKDFTMKDIQRMDYSLNDEEEAYKGDDIGLDEEEQDIDMDLILAESITKYTLMELCYTIKLENYTYDSLQKISQKLLN